MNSPRSVLFDAVLGRACLPDSLAGTIPWRALSAFRISPLLFCGISLSEESGFRPLPPNLTRLAP